MNHRIQTFAFATALGGLTAVTAASHANAASNPFLGNSPEDKTAPGDLCPAFTRELKGILASETPVSWRREAVEVAFARWTAQSLETNNLPSVPLFAAITSQGLRDLQALEEKADESLPSRRTHTFIAGVYIAISVLQLGMLAISLISVRRLKRSEEPLLTNRQFWTIQGASLLLCLGMRAILGHTEDQIQERESAIHEPVVWAKSPEVICDETRALIARSTTAEGPARSSP